MPFSFKSAVLVCVLGMMCHSLNASQGIYFEHRQKNTGIGIKQASFQDTARGINNAGRSVNVDKVLVEKAKRKMTLWSNGRAVRQYKVSLGKKSKGAKRMEGDLRTPEGMYWIDWRKHSANFNLSLHLSYPNPHDQRQAELAGVKPGGMIMIHGTPLDGEYPEDVFQKINWTNGCIALVNRDMEEVWDLVSDGTLIEIKP